MDVGFIFSRYCVAKLEDEDQSMDYGLAQLIICARNKVQNSARLSKPWNRTKRARRTAMNELGRSIEHCARSTPDRYRRYLARRFQEVQCR